MSYVEADAAPISFPSAPLPSPAGVDLHRHLGSARWDCEPAELELEARGEHGEEL